MKTIKQLFANKYLNDVLKSLIGSFFFRLVSFVISLYISNVVGASDYGIFSTIKSFSSIFSSILCFGLHVTFISFISSNSILFREKKLFINWGFLNVLILSVLSFVVLILLRLFFDLNILKYWLLIYVYGLTFSLDRLIISLIQGYRRYDVFLRLNIFTALIYIVLVSLSVFVYGFIGALYSISFVFLLRFFVIYWQYVSPYLSFTNIRLSLNIKNQSLSSVKKSSALIFSGEIFYSVTQFVTIWGLKVFSDYENVGSFALCMLFSNIMLFFVSTMSNVFFSHLSLQKNIIRFCFKNMLINIAIISIPFMLFVFNIEFLLHNFEIDYPFITQTMFVFFISIFFQIIGVFSEKVLYFFNKIKLVQILNISRQVVIVIFTIFLLSFWRTDSVAAGSGFLLGVFVIAILKLYFLFRVTSSNSCSE